MTPQPTTISFTVTFRTPFAVTSGNAGDGLDSRVDRDELLPASSLKGLMRAEATTTLAVPDDDVGSVYGVPGIPSSWAWTDGAVVTPEIEPRARLKIIGEGRADEGSLLLADQVWAPTATFAVTLMAGLVEDDHRRQLIILRASARSITSLGAARRRGQGWVTVVDNQPWTIDDTSALRAIRTGADRA